MDSVVVTAMETTPMVVMADDPAKLFSSGRYCRARVCRPGVEKTTPSSTAVPLRTVARPRVRGLAVFVVSTKTTWPTGDPVSTTAVTCAESDTGTPTTGGPGRANGVTWVTAATTF